MCRIPILVLFLFILSCSHDKPAQETSPTKAFYYWQTSIGSFNWSDSLFQSMKISKLYCRFFDVGWSDEARAPIPISPLDIDDVYNWKVPAEVVPVVFITNETFKKLSPEQAVDLARHVHKKVMAKLSVWLMSNTDVYGEYEREESWKHDPYAIRSANFDEQKKHDSLYVARMKAIREVQFDCDWTPSTKDKYFAFLEETKKLFKEQVISSTIRLYQYKYPEKAGLPPVKRGMLMCYNAGDVRDAKTRNSIFDKEKIMAYLETSDYPIPLDYALPIFQWALLYHDNELQRIFPAPDLLEEYKPYLRSKDEHRLEVEEDFVYGHSANSLFVRKGDEIRLETPNMQDVEEVAAWLSKHKNNKEAILSLYHLNHHDLQKHSQAIDAIFHSF